MIETKNFLNIKPTKAIIGKSRNCTACQGTKRIIVPTEKNCKTIECPVCFGTGLGTWNLYK